MVFVASPARMSQPENAHILSIDIIVDSTGYFWWDPRLWVLPTDALVRQGQNFVIRHRLCWYEPAAGYYTLDVYWDCPENKPDENFTFLSARAYFDNNDAIENNVVFMEGPKLGEPQTTRYLVGVSATTGDNRDGEFNVDILMNASGVRCIAHILDNHVIYHGGVDVGEDTWESGNPPYPITISVTPMFSLVTLYKVGLEADLYAENGSKLVVKFYNYSDIFEDENIIENFVPPAHVEENVWHPQGIGVKKVRLDLTTDNTKNVISTVATFTVTRDTLAGRLVGIYLDWAFASLERKNNVLIPEIVDLYLQWAFAPF